MDSKTILVPLVLDSMPSLVTLKGWIRDIKGAPSMTVYFKFLINRNDVFKEMLSFETKASGSLHSIWSLLP